MKAGIRRKASCCTVPIPQNRSQFCSSKPGDHAGFIAKQLLSDHVTRSLPLALGVKCRAMQIDDCPAPEHGTPRPSQNSYCKIVHRSSIPNCRQIWTVSTGGVWKICTGCLLSFNHCQK